MRSALLLGATGLVGHELLQKLEADPNYEKVVAFVRKPLPTAHPNVQAVVVNYDNPDTYVPHLGQDDVFCCLGTTIAKAGSQAAFRKVDLEIPLAVAKASLAAGTRRYLVITAVGADAQSSIFYNRIKGELEGELRQLRFPEGVKLFHPSLLLGERGEKRAGEVVGAVMMKAARPLFIGKLQRYRAIDAADVAQAMLTAATGTDTSVRVYEGADLFAAARSPPERPREAQRSPSSRHRL